MSLEENKALVHNVTEAENMKNHSDKWSLRYGCCIVRL